MDEAPVLETWIDPVMGFRVTVHQVGSEVATADGQPLWWSFEPDRAQARAEVVAELARFSREVRTPTLHALAPGSLPGPIRRMAADVAGRWAAIGGAGPEGWLAASTLQAPVRLALGDRAEVHWLGEEIMVIGGSRWSTLITRVDVRGEPSTIATVARATSNSCTTDTSVLLTFGYGQGSPWLAFDREGRLVFDFDRDLVEVYEDRGRRGRSGMRRTVNEAIARDGGHGAPGSSPQRRDRNLLHRQRRACAEMAG